MRILVHDFSGHPFQIQLSRALAARGDDVLHAYCGDILTPKGPLARRPDDPVGFDVRDLGAVASSPSINSDGAWSTRRATRGGSPQRARVPPGRRVAVERSSGCSAAGGTGLPARGVPVVLWLQDLYALGLSLLFRQRLGRLASAPTLVAELARTRRALRGCAAIVVIGKEFVEPVRGWCGASTPVHCIANWAPLIGTARSAEGEPAELPARPRPALRLPLLGHAGVEARHRAPAASWARTVRSWPDAELVVCSEGPGARHVAAEARDRGLTTTRVIDYQPYERLPELLGAADVLVGRARPERGVALGAVEGVDVPRRGPADPRRDRHANSAAEFIEAADSGLGRRTRPTRSDGRRRGAGCTTTPPLGSRLGANVRAAAEAHFDIDEIADAFRAVLAIGGTARGGRPMIDALVGSGRARLLVVAAHADDDALGAGGTIARRGRRGAAVHVVVCSHSVLSRGLEADVAEHVKAQRRAAAQKAASRLGASLTLLDLPDNAFESVPLLELVQSLEAVVADFRPTAVLSHSAADLSRDHELVSRAALTVARPIPGRPIALLAFEIRSATDWTVGTGRARSNPRCGSRSTNGRGERSSSSSTSTRTSCVRVRTRDRSKASTRSARYRGTQVGVERAEAFALLRAVVP